MKLTKSKFRRFLECRNEYWLDHHFPEETALTETLEYRHRRETGYEVEILARTLAIFAESENAAVHFSRDFATDELFAKADIVVTDRETGEIDIYEVKSGTKAKDDYIVDLAFQCHVASAAGFRVRQAYLILLDTSYVFDGTLHADRVLMISDQTEAVRLRGAAIPDEIADALALLEGEEPSPALTEYCSEKLACRFIARHFPDIPEYNVSHIFSKGSKKLNDLLSRGLFRISDIPEDFVMTDRELAKVNVERKGEPDFDLERIMQALEPLAYPLNFLDYESYNAAVPKFVNTRPYQQMVFQYSLHSVDAPGAQLRHSYHLSRNDRGHPCEEIVERLYEDLNGRIGTVIIWSEGFEKSRNNELGQMFPHRAEFLAEINAAVFDLRKIFSERLYMHPRFHGRDSIKVVLPVLSNLTYDGMPIGDGMTASIKWYHAATGRGTSEEREQIFADLEAYCHQDTLAMVEIFQFLQRL
jgi:hypothetical protein